MPPDSEVRSSIQSTTVIPPSAAVSSGVILLALFAGRLGERLERLGKGVGIGHQFLGRVEVSKRAGYRYCPMPSSGWPGSRGEKRSSSELTE